MGQPRRCALALLVLALAPLPTRAADRRIELGFVPLAGSVTSDEGSFTIVGAPAPPPAFAGSSRGLYLQWFATEKIGIEPQISAISAFGDGDSEHMIALAARASYHFSGRDQPSVYLFGGGGVQYVTGDGYSHSSPSLAAGVGYRWPAGPFSVRIEASYERTFDGWGSPHGSNVLGGAVGVALRF